MKRDKSLLEKRTEYIKNYFNEESKKGKSTTVVVEELTNILFLSERTIYNSLSK